MDFNNIGYVGALLVLILIIYEIFGEKPTMYILTLIIISIVFVKYGNYTITKGTPKMIGG